MSESTDKNFMDPDHAIDHTHEDDQPEDLTLRERPLTLADVRSKLQAKTGKQYWRTLEELAGDPHFEELLHRRSEEHTSELQSRRDLVCRLLLEKKKQTDHG